MMTSARPVISLVSTGVILTLVLIAVSITGCARVVPPVAPAGEDPLDEIFATTFGAVSPTSSRTAKLPRSAYHARWFFQDRLDPPRVLPPYGRIDSELVRTIAGLAPLDPVDVIVTFRDTVDISPFPRARVELARNAPANVALLDSAAAIIQRVQVRRRPQYQQDTLVFHDSLGARSITTFWVTQACKMTLPAGNVNRILKGPNVVYLANDKGPPPPGPDAVPENDLINGRQNLNSEVYRSLVAPDGWMALLDTGIETRHRLLHAPNPLCMVADCYNELGTGLLPSQCNVFLSDGTTIGGGDVDKLGHGTGTANTLTGNGNDIPAGTPNGIRFRGITRASLDSYVVYDGSNNVRAGAVLRGLELAMARLDPVIVVESQGSGEPPWAAVSAAADRAHGLGFAILATAGNNAKIGVPAATRRTLGIGAFNLPLGLPEGSMPHGPVEGRIKPDLLAQSSLETAGAGSLEAMRAIGQTSGAAPFAGGAACLFRNWLIANGAPPPDPGKIFALMLLSGEEVGPFAVDSPKGVGLIHMPRVGTARCGKLWVSSAVQRVDIPIPIPAGTSYRRLTAAIWWPERPAPVDTHNDLNLEIIAPGVFGPVVQSDGVDGVFERASIAPSAPLTGKWKVRIRAKTMRTPWQFFYVAVALTP